MRIGIDARQASHRKQHGLRTYVINLVRALSRIDGQNEYTVYLEAKNPHPFKDLPSNFHLQILPWRFRHVSTILNGQELFWAGKWSWESTARETLKVYEDIYQKGGQ